MRKIYALGIALAICILWMFRTPPATLLLVGLDDTFEQVKQASSFPVAASSDDPSEDELGFGATWVKEPAVIIRFNDPQFGFTLPPTTFAAIGYMHHRVDTITTSPMLKKVTFEQGMAEVARLQGIFREQGWQLENGTTWFDLSPGCRAALHSTIRLGSYGYGKWVSLRAAGKYSMIFRMRCASGCDSDIGFDRYLIDISIGHDSSMSNQPVASSKEGGKR